jgi:hypothetical protein
MKAQSLASGALMSTHYGEVGERQTSNTLPLHDEASAEIQVDAMRLFETLDNHARLSSHMARPSWRMGGATMEITTDAGQGRHVGSVITLRGQVLGLRLSVDELVTVHQPPTVKVWQTIGTPRLLVVGAYRMRFDIEPRGSRSLLRVSIDYTLPRRGVERVIGWLFGRMYARWCTRQMVTDASRL